MSGTEPPILEKYAEFLEDPDVKRRNFEGTIFYHPEKVRSWISLNAESMLSAVFTDGFHFPPVEASRITSLPLVLAILAHPQIQCANMIDLFKQHIEDDSMLDKSSLLEQYAAVIKDLEYHRRPIQTKFQSAGYEGITKEFDKLRWAFCPVSLTFEMHKSFRHGLSILPFCYADVVNEKGGTANVHHIKIQTDLVNCEQLREKLRFSQHVHNQFGLCYEFAVKSYLPEWRDIYLLESNAFRGVKTLDGVVTYLGEYHLNGGAEIPAKHNILLEYAERDLDEYLADTYAPVLNNEIIAFWEGIFEIAETIQQMHKLKVPGANGRARVIRGWHGDLKPDNILRVKNGKYKLADFGFAKFEEDNAENLSTFLVGGTRTYGAPECDAKRMGGTSTPHLQTIDTWSFGCVLSAVATWVVLGSQAYNSYGQIRQRAIAELRRRQKNNMSISIPTCDDAFHDGQKVLSAVTDWHRHLRNSARRSDTITHLVLDLIDEKMLIVDPQQRSTSDGIRSKLQHILAAARIDYNREIRNPDNLLKEETPQTLQMLLELDKEAPAEAKPQADVKRAPSMDAGETDGKLLPPSNRAQRVRKSERMDKILIGKIANRAPVLKDLTTSLRGDMCESPKPMSAVVEEPSPHAFEGQAKGPEYPAISSIKDALQGQSSVTAHLRTGDSVTNGDSARYYTSQKAYPIDIPKNSSHVQSGVSTTSPIAHEMPSHDSHVLRNRTQPSIPKLHVSHDGGNRHEHGSSFGSYLSELPTEEALMHHSMSAEPRFNQKSTPRNEESIDTEPVKSPRSGPYDILIDAERTAIYQEYRDQLQIWQDRSILSTLVGTGPSADPHLKKFIYNRDMKFVVDNAASMRRHWPHVKICLLALAMKVGRLDKDGLDLSFTIGESRNMNDVKGDNIRKRFTKAMDKAISEISDSDSTDMAASLSTLFDAYVNKKKRQTLIILTDGLWQGGNAERDDVETSIKEFTRDLNRKLKKMEKRWFTIQFISFGRDASALQRLTDLDDGLETDDDVVDHKPWDFTNVEHMILGSIRQDADAAIGSSHIVAAASIRRPSPSPSRSGTKRLTKFFNSSEVS